MFGVLLVAAIQLTGVTGLDLRARAFFDANNVKIGDPLVLTIDFLGSAEFKDLHPPALAKVVDRKTWKIDDVSAKTDTYRDARRLTYRVRPMREGVLWFPALEFAYASPDGRPCVVRANEIPVHAKPGAQVVVAEMGEDLNAMPKPPELIGSGDALVAALSDDMAFAWRKALAAPTADKFAAFDFPAAKMNEATMAIREGNWARAMNVYASLEWRIGQTPEIEKGIVAALALKYDNPSAELPVWRVVGRPVLRYAWLGRVGLVLGTLLGLTFLFWLLGRGIRALACVAVAVLLTGIAEAETTVEETVTTNANGAVIHRKVVKGGNGMFSFSSTTSSGGKGVGRGFEPLSLFEEFDNFDPFGRRQPQARRQPVNIGVSLTADKPSVTVGENFNLVLTLEVPRTVTIDGGVRLSIAEQDRMTQVGAGQNLPNLASKNPTNRIQRLVFPMRANVAFTNLHYSVAGDYAFSGDSFFFFRESRPFESGRRVAPFTVTPLPEAGRPADFSGIIAESAVLHEYCDLLKVETNDVVTVTYRLRTNGYVPASFQPKDVAFEWGRQSAPNGMTEIEYRRYVVADGAATTPVLTLSYYDPQSRRYKSVAAGATRLKYDIIKGN